MLAPNVKKSEKDKLDPQNIFLDKDFLLLWASQFFTSMAASVFGIAIAIVSNTGEASAESSAFSVALILFFTNIPALFFSIIAGVLSDWFDRKMILTISSLMRFILAMIFVFFTGWESAVFAYVIIFLKSSITQIYMPANASIIPDIMKKENLMTANTIFNITNYATYIGGIVAAGAFIERFGNRGTFFTLGTMFFFGAMVIPFIKVTTTHKPISSDIFNEIFKEAYLSLKEGIKYVLKGTVQKIAMFHNFLTTSIIFVVITVIFKLSDFLLDLDPRRVGLVTLLPIMIGIVLSMLYMNILGKNKKRMSLVHNGVIVTFFAFAFIALLSILRFHGVDIFGIDNTIFVRYGTLAAMGIVGLGFPLLIIPAQTLMQEDTDEDVLGRVFGLWFAVNQALSTIPAIFIGLLADSSLGIPTTAVVLSIVIFIYALFLIPFRRLA